MADEDESAASSGSESEPAPSGEESEPAPAGEGEEPAPAGESASSDSDTNLEPAEATSDSSAETDGSDSDSSSDSSAAGRKRKSSSSSGDSDSSSSESSQKSSEPPLPSESEVAGALTSAFQMRDVRVDDDGVKVTLEDGLFQLMVRVSAQGTPLPQVPDDTSNLAPGSVTGAKYLLQGSVQVIGDQTRVNLRLVSVETSQILEVGQGNSSGDVLAGIQGAAEDALASLPTLGAT